MKSDAFMSGWFLAWGISGLLQGHTVGVFFLSLGAFYLFYAIKGK